MSRDNFFDILLVFVFFLQTYCGICFFHILSFYFFLLRISFFIIFIIFLYHFDNNLSLYLVSRLCFSDNKLIQRNFIQRSCIHSLFIYNKIIYKTLILLTKLKPFIMLIASSLVVYQKLIL